ncbi:MAG: hypothetical protein IJT01_11195 [Selenomonadaceae bacterium]|nr:hypothetical protein [Selenomonadaceae bacterium]
MRNKIFLPPAYLLALLSFLLFLPAPTARAASLYEYPNVAVLPYANKAAVSSQLSLADASLVSEFVIEKLLDSERFNVVEREVLMNIMQEHNLNMSGMIDPMTAVQVGKLAGAQYFVAGSVTGLSTKSSGLGYEHSRVGGLNANKNTVIANVTARFIDIETGRVVMAVSGTGESASTNMEFKLNQNKTTTIETTGYDDYTEEEYIAEGEETSTTTHTIRIGTQDFSQVQVRNALYKAVDDLIFNKNYGVLAKMDGKWKRRKV